MTRREPAGSGAVEARTVQGDPGLTYFLYRPSRGRPGTPVFVSIHGRSRNAARHAELFAPFAERFGFVLIAPLFPPERFPDYHCLGRNGRGDRADLALHVILEEVGRETGAVTESFALFGYSGGGQFGHRYLLAHPERLTGIAIGAAGWYTLPDPTLGYPHGLRLTRDLPGVVMDPDRFLRRSCLVLVGEQDIVREESLLQDPEVDSRQGTTRVARARRWVEAMNGAAAGRGLDPPCRFELLPGVGHSFVACMTAGDLGEQVFAHLLAAGSSPATVGDGPRRTPR